MRMLYFVRTVTKLIVMHLHKKVGHQGRHLTHGETRSNGYHIHKGASVIRQLISECILCKKLRGNTSTQLMSDLPADRLEEVPPFYNCGLDVLGHFHISQKRATGSHPGSRKIWAVIFVYLVSHAVHIEPLPSMDTSSFRNALPRLMCISKQDYQFR